MARLIAYGKGDGTSSLCRTGFEQQRGRKPSQVLVSRSYRQGQAPSPYRTEGNPDENVTSKNGILSTPNYFAAFARNTALLLQGNGIPLSQRSVRQYTDCQDKAGSPLGGLLINDQIVEAVTASCTALSKTFQELISWSANQ